MECFDAIAWAIPPYFRGDGGRTENCTLRRHPNLAVTSNICRSDPSLFFWKMGIMMLALWHLCLKSSSHVWSVEKGDYVSYLHRRGLLKEKKKSEYIHEYEHEHAAWNSNKWFHLLNCNWITRGDSAINALCLEKLRVWGSKAVHLSLFVKALRTCPASLLHARWHSLLPLPCPQCDPGKDNRLGREQHLSS